MDDYLEFCAQRGEGPDRPYSGHFVLRIDPELHRALSVAAEARKTSLNALVEEALKSAFAPLAPGQAAASPPQGMPTKGKRKSTRAG